MGPDTDIGMILFNDFYTFLRQYLSVNQGLTIRLEWLVTECWDPPVTLTPLSWHHCSVLLRSKLNAQRPLPFKSPRIYKWTPIFSVPLFLPILSPFYTLSVSCSSSEHFLFLCACCVCVICVHVFMCVQIYEFLKCMCMWRSVFSNHSPL